MILGIFTKELGMVDASVQAMREIRSKLRMGLSDLTFSDLSLVRGKNIWKITGASSCYNLFECFRDDRVKMDVAANIAALLKRMLSGEEKNKEMFILIASGFEWLKEERLSEREVKNFEAVMVMRILNFLGYAGDKLKFEEFLRGAEWSREILDNMAKKRTEALKEINVWLKESQL